MGNSFPSNGFKYVGTNASYQYVKEDIYFGEPKIERWTVTYLDLSIVVFLLERTYGKDGDTKFLRFKFKDPGAITFIVDRAENNILSQIEIRNFGLSYDANFVNETKNQPMHMMFYTAGIKTGGNLLVVETKRNNGVEEPFAETVAHYYAISSRSFIRRKKYDVGLSMMVDIRVLNNDLDISVKGPSEHPSLALLQMFQQVSRTWTWKWTACPHCAAEAHRRQHNGVMGQQFETHEKDDEERNYLQWPAQIGGNILANQGVIKGNNNGNLFVINLSLEEGNYL